MQLPIAAPVYSFKLLDSATNELKLHCLLRNFIKDIQKFTTTIPPLFVEISSAYLISISGTFLERLAIFARFSDQTSSAEKQKMVKELLRYQCYEGFPSNTRVQQMSVLNNGLNFKHYWKRFLDFVRTTSI